MSLDNARRVKMVTLKIPDELYQKLSQMLEGTGFRSVTEFATYVLRDIAAGGKLDKESHGLSDSEIEAVRKRLRSLGYIEQLELLAKQGMTEITVETDAEFPRPHFERIAE